MASLGAFYLLVLHAGVSLLRALLAALRDKRDTDALRITYSFPCTWGKSTSPSVEIYDHLIDTWDEVRGLRRLFPRAERTSPKEVYPPAKVFHKLMYI